MRECRIVNEGQIREGDARAENGIWQSVGEVGKARGGDIVIDCGGQYLFPGLIDDQVHFREPGLTDKADIASESRAAAAGGVTSFMEMPNVRPPTLDAARLRQKLDIAARDSRVNYAFYLGANGDNLESIRALDPRAVAGIKVFMGSSTGDMVIDDEERLRAIFTAAPCLVAAHCEDDKIVAANLERARARFGGDIPPRAHAQIRDARACFSSSSRAARIARETGARLHILHITSAVELDLFAPGDGDKQITAEACAHHLLFCDDDYARLGMRLKCNPAVKTRADRDALRDALRDGRIDVAATDHAPHLAAEKDAPYEKAAAGLPLIEFALPALLESTMGESDFALIAKRGAHRVADLFSIPNRGYLRAGMAADCALIDWRDDPRPTRKTLFSKCGWSPFAEMKLRARVALTVVNGEIVYRDDETRKERIDDSVRGQALAFAR